MSDFYHHHADAYFKRTVSVDPSAFLMPFVRALPENATVLDIGCGSGRDLLWLKNRGFSPAGLERSPGLAGLAAAHSGCEVISGDFETHDFSSHLFDAILASGALVHVPHYRLAGVLENITRALTPGGIFYVSLKEGQGAKSDNSGRTFYLWQAPDLIQLFENLGFRVRHQSNTTSVLNSRDPWLGFVLRLDFFY